MWRLERNPTDEDPNRTRPEHWKTSAESARMFGTKDSPKAHRRVQALWDRVPGWSEAAQRDPQTRLVSCPACAASCLGSLLRRVLGAARCPASCAVYGVLCSATTGPTARVRTQGPPTSASMAACSACGEGARGNRAARLWAWLPYVRCLLLL